MKLTISLLLTVFIAVSGAVASAGTVVTRITNNGYSDSYPHLEGDYLVWQAQVTGDQEIFCYNRATGTTTQITDNEHDDISPWTDGVYVVWQGLENGEWDVFIWDGSEPQTISQSGTQDYCPMVSNGFVVWTSEPVYADRSIGPGEVVLYNTDTQTQTILSAVVDPENTLDDTSPRINNEVVIWLQTDDQSNARIYVYDLNSGMITENPDYQFRDSRRTDGSLSVLTRNAGEDKELFLYNSESTRTHQISDNGFHDRYPCISGNHIAWMAEGEIFLAEFKYLGLISPRDTATIPETEPASFTWEGIGYNDFKVQFSPDEDFPETHTLILPSEEVLFTGSSFTPMMSEWRLIRRMERRNGRVFWRVEGRETNGAAALSEARTFSFADTGAGSIDQSAADAVINGDGGMSDGAGSSCFIDTVNR